MAVASPGRPRRSWTGAAWEAGMVCLSGTAPPARRRLASRGFEGQIAVEKRWADLAAASSPIPPRANERRDIASASEGHLCGLRAGHGQEWPAQAQAATVFLNTKDTKEGEGREGVERYCTKRRRR